MRKKARSVPLLFYGLLAVSVILFGCSGSSSDINGPNGQKLGTTASPSPSPSPSSSPSPSPSPTASPDPSPSPGGSPSPSPSPSASPTPPASAQPFDVFFVEKAEVEQDRDVGDQRFEVRGSFLLGVSSDGLDLATDSVFVKLGSFEQIIPAGLFQRHDEGFRFESESAGVERLELDDNGGYRIEARDLDLSGIALPSEVPFLLRIGNDFGETDIPLDSRGRFDNPNPQPSPSPSPTASPEPSPSPTASPDPSPSPTASPSPSPSPTASPSPSPSPTGSPSPTPSPSGSPSPSPSPSVTPSPSPSPEVHVRGAIEALVVNSGHSGEITVQGISFLVTANTKLEDDDGNDISMNDFEMGETVEAWGPPPNDNRTEARRIRKR